MFVKLLRLEAKMTSRIFLPLMGAVMALSGLSMLAVRLAGPAAVIIDGDEATFTGPAAYTGLPGTIVGLLTLGAFLGMAGLMVTSVIVAAQRFYKNLLGDEGYLMFTLPATPAQHLLAKLTVGVGWSTASLLLVLALTTAIVGSIPVTMPDGRTPLGFALATLQQEIPLPLGQWAGIMLLIFLVGVCFAYLMMYLSMVIGAQQTGGWPHSRLGRSILVYVLLHILVSLVEGGAGWLMSAAAFALGFDPLREMTGASQYLTASAGSLVVLAAGSLVWFFIARRLLENRLDLA